MLVLLLSGGGEALGAASPPSPPPPRWSVDENAAVLGGERKGPARAGSLHSVCLSSLTPRAFRKMEREAGLQSKVE